MDVFKPKGEATETTMPELEAEDRELIQRAYRQLLKSFKKPISTEDHGLVRGAFEIAVEAHKEQRRKSGEPYILHPIEVARICVEEIGLGPTAVACALLHDVVEDTDVTLEEIEARFGPAVARIVDGLTKLDSLHENQNPQAENFKKVLTSMLLDVRVVLIKMADRLHNLRTIGSMAEHKQIKIAAETEFVYAPLAHRLGLHAIKNELQDICLRIMHRKEYDEIESKLASSEAERAAFIEAFCRPIREKLDALKVKYRIVGRPKSAYSIFNKLKKKGASFEDLYDLFAVRIIFEVERHQESTICFTAFGHISQIYQAVPERWKDWVSNPKSNGYESLHTTVIGPGGRFVEVQIRTERMDEIAERGYASHWRYKGVQSASAVNTSKIPESSSANAGFEKWLDGVREMLENPASNAIEFLADFQSALFHEEIRVFTPKGDILTMPEGASALDFAFAVHTEVGSRTFGVKVNGMLVPLGTRLKNGDRCEVLTRNDIRPSEDWLKMTITGKAQSRIRAALKDSLRKAGEAGKEQVERKCAALKVDFDHAADLLAKKGGFGDRLELFLALAKEQVSLSAMLKNFKAEAGRLAPILEEKIHVQPAPAAEKKAVAQKGPLPQIIINGDASTIYSYTLASCCQPVKGDPIFAYTSPQGVKIHRMACKNATNLLATYSYRILKAEWGGLTGSDFVADLIITGVDSGRGVILKLSSQITEDLGLNMRAFSISSHEQYYEARISILVSSVNQIAMAVLALKQVDGVNSVVRAEEAAA